MNNNKQEQNKNRLMNVLLDDVVLSVDLPASNTPRVGEVANAAAPAKPAKNVAPPRPSTPRRAHARNASPCYRAGLELVGHGFIVYGIAGRHDDPRLEGLYSEPLVTPEDVRGYFDLYPDQNLAIATGLDAGVVGVVAAREAIHNGSLSRLNQIIPTSALRGITSSGERFLLLRHPIGTRFFPGPIAELPGVRIAADGDYVVAPPSHDRWNGRYTWSRGFRPAPRSQLLEIPRELLGYMRPLAYPPDSDGEKGGAA